LIKAEILRKVLNLGALFLPLLFYHLPYKTGRLVLATIALVIVTADVLRLHFSAVKDIFVIAFGSFLRRHEFLSLTGATYLILGAVVCSILFNKIITIAACSFLLVGDSVAAMLGQTIGRIRLVGSKTLVGSLGFFASCLVVVMLIPELKFEVGLSGAIAATLIEALPIPIDDNFSVPLVSALVMFYLS